MRLNRYDAKPDDGHVHEIPIEGEPRSCIRCGIDAPKKLIEVPRPKPVSLARPWSRPAPAPPAASRLASVDPRLAPSNRATSTVVDASEMFRTNRKDTDTP